MAAAWDEEPNEVRLQAEPVHLAGVDRRRRVTKGNSGMSDQSTLTELVKARVDKKTKSDLATEARRTDRSEGSIVRLALREYLSKRKGK